MTLEQLEQRAATVYSAQTREQAVATIADLPPLPGMGGAGAERPEGARGRGLGRLVGLGRRGHGDADAPGAAWLPTRERFRDPGSGRIMRVWVDPVSGARRYVSDDG